MFNGLVREIAKVRSFSQNRLVLEANYRPNLGDSIAVNGACLSVREVFSGAFSVELSSESLENLAVENFKNFVHIEPAMKLGERIDGHLMQGHIDFLGEISRIEKLKSGTNFYINLPPKAMKFMAHKGSVGVDGISLTISEVLANAIKLTLIPITLEDTLFGSYAIKRRVNIESDMMARYADRVLNFGKNSNENGSGNLGENEQKWQEIEKALSLY